MLTRWDDVFAVPLDVKCMKLCIAGEKAKKEILLTESILGSCAGKSTGCVHAWIEHDPVHEVDMVNVFKVQNVAGQVPLSLSHRVRATLKSLTVFSRTYPYEVSI